MSWEIPSEIGKTWVLNHHPNIKHPNCMVPKNAEIPYIHHGFVARGCYFLNGGRDYLTINNGDLMGI